MKLTQGVYENLINKEISEDIRKAEENNMVCQCSDIDDAESPSMLAQYLSKIIRNKLDNDDLSNEQRIDFVNRILQISRVGDNSQIVKKDKFLSEVKSPVQQARETATGRQVDRPLSGFRVSNLFTGGNSELSLNSEIQKDIASADRICIIVSFLKLSGLHLIYDNLKDFCNQEGHILRVITTTYCGITEAKAVEQLSNLPRTEYVFHIIPVLNVCMLNRIFLSVIPDWILHISAHLIFRNRPRLMGWNGIFVLLC
jgi:hypothetical protein